MDTKRAYAALGLREGAGEDEIKQAYRALAQKFDPENYEAGPLREDAERKMNEINEAFDAADIFFYCNLSHFNRSPFSS